MTLSSTSSGDELYALVEAYAALGEHRTGTPVDDATRDWFAQALAQRGGHVERKPFTFDRYEAEVQVHIGGRLVQAMPLFYEAVGEVACNAPHVAEIAAIDSDAGALALADALAATRAAGATMLVVATAHPLGELQAPNRKPQLGGGLPVVLVAGREAEALRSGAVSASLKARIVPGKSENVLGRFGSDAPDFPPPLLIATPLSGWFGCAAERGTGIALALALAQRFSARRPLLIVGSPGHELMPHIGLQSYLVDSPPEPVLVVHLGANVALGRRSADDRMTWVASRAIGARMSDAEFAAVTPHLAPLGVEVRFNPPRWVGEGELWSHHLKSPLLSFVGIGPQFHTPADTPSQTTSPELLATAFHAIGDALDAWIRLQEDQRA